MCADVLPRFLTLRFTEKNIIQICSNVSAGRFYLECLRSFFYLKTASSLCVFMVIIFVVVAKAQVAVTIFGGCSSGLL
jgi:hypothetical protein